MSKSLHRYDEIRQQPTTFNNVHQSIYRSHQILQEVKRMLAEFYNSEAILDIIAMLETDLPSTDKESDIGSARRVYIVKEDE